MFIIIKEKLIVQIANLNPPSHPTSHPLNGDKEDSLNLESPLMGGDIRGG